jgi:hypothetical protein
LQEEARRKVLPDFFTDGTLPFEEFSMRSGLTNAAARLWKENRVFEIRMEPVIG